MSFAESLGIWNRRLFQSLLIIKSWNVSFFRFIDNIIYQQRKARGECTMADDVRGILPVIRDYHFPVYTSFITNHLISKRSDTFYWENATVGYIEE